jgi:integrase
MTALRSMSVARPRVKVQTPCWDLSLVLRALMEEPFEPVKGPLERILLLKTVFLVALATAQRRSELHALSCENISFNKERGRCNWYLCQAYWRRTRRLTPLGARLLSLPCQQQLIVNFS